MSGRTLLASARRIAAHGDGSSQASDAVAAPTFSIVIPTYNEARDIGETLAHVLRQRVPAIEVIVVDGGSSDDTLRVVHARDAHGRVIVIDERQRGGVAAARNAGIRRAAGDVVVLLNADVLLPPDFLERLSVLYRDDVDLVSVESRVRNLNCVPGRYIDAMHRLRYRADSVGWSEGFSCRREVALAVSFPEEIPGAGGEDVEFVERLLRAGGRWTVDYGIVVEHRVPDTLGGLWSQFAGRGRAVPYAERYLRNRSCFAVTCRRALASVLSAATAFALVPHALTIVRMTRYAPNGRRDAGGLWLAHHLAIAAHRFGEWQGLAAMWRVRGRRR